MSHSDLRWRDSRAGQGSTDANYGNEPEFHMMAVSKPVDLQVFEPDEEGTLEQNRSRTPSLLMAR
jgi:hypothetical protein